MPEWGHQTGEWNNPLWRSCGGLLEWDLGHRVWWLLVSFWCNSCLQTAGIQYNWWRLVKLHSMVCIWLDEENQNKLCYLVNQIISLVVGIGCINIYVFDHNSLFCSLGAQALSRAPFGQGTGQPILLDNLICTSRETRLVDCTHNGIGVHNCLHSEDAGVRCPEPPCMYCLNCQCAYTTERDASFHCV